jgi:hypothetical protein
LASGRVVWKVLNYEEPSGVELAKRFDVAMPTVILAKMKGGQIEDWKSLDKVWALVQDKPAFAEFVRGEIRQMLGTVTSQAANLANAAEPEIPDPAVGAAGESAPLPPMDIPIPQETMAPPAKAGRVRDPTYKMRAPCARPTRRVARQGSALKSQIRISKCETNSKHEWPKSKTP